MVYASMVGACGGNGGGGAFGGAIDAHTWQHPKTVPSSVSAIEMRLSGTDVLNWRLFAPLLLIKL